MMNVEILREYVESGISRRKQAKRLRVTEIKKIRKSHQFTIEFIDSDYEDWYDVIVNVSELKNGLKIQIGDKSSFCTFEKIESAINEINEHLSWRKLRK